MLLVDNEQLSQQDFADLFGINLTEIRKRPSFETDASNKSKDLANGGVVRVNEGNAIRTRFFAMHPKKKIKVEIAYALSTRTETVGNIERTINEPRYITYKGEKFSFKEDIDKALWMYLHPMNKFSPLRDADSKAKSGFEFIDVGKRTKARMTEMSGLRKALDHAESISMIII